MTIKYLNRYGGIYTTQSVEKITFSNGLLVVEYWRTKDNSTFTIKPEQLLSITK
jgi:hypothetical protein